MDDPRPVRRPVSNCAGVTARRANELGAVFSSEFSKIRSYGDRASIAQSDGESIFPSRREVFALRIGTRLTPVIALAEFGADLAKDVYHRFAFDPLGDDLLPHCVRDRV